MPEEVNPQKEIEQILAEKPEAIPAPEQPVIVEKVLETKPEIIAPPMVEKKQPLEKTGEATGPVATTISVKPKTAEDIRGEQIDRILAEGLDELYLGLPEQKKKEFRQTGEATAKKINQLLTEVKIKVFKIVDLIRKWLGSIPGVNKFFLEQEAKIKADKIVKLKN